ncbi:MAG TPA: NADH-quinone oxidoreductase subunit J [Rhodanobacteraceae bacterium]|nr:NADH-quinone oxidoreductase subunit J [Rhodanobacteraceae bacterium]
MNHALFQQVCFVVFAVFAVGAALTVVSAKNTVHAVLALVLTFFSAACLWILAEAEFLALALVVVYVGAVMVLFLFVVMMLDIELEPLREGFIKYLPVGIGAAVIMLIEMLGIIGVRAFNVMAGPNPAGASNIEWLGEALFTHFLLPFEIAAVILTVGLVAAVVLALRVRTFSKHQNPARQSAVRVRDRVRMVKMAATLPAAPPATTAQEPKA